MYLKYTWSFFILKFKIHISIEIKSHQFIKYINDANNDVINETPFEPNNAWQGMIHDSKAFAVHKATVGFTLDKSNT